MTFQAQLVMIVSLPVVIFLFTIFPPRKAVMVSLIGAVLFLPERAGFDLSLIPNYKGEVAAYYGIFIGIIIFDNQRLKQFKPSWIDLPVFLFGISPLFSSLTNGLGIYDGVNQSISLSTQWGVPYLLGRLYFNNLSNFKELAIAIVKGGLLYLPLCLYEIRMSPQLHAIVYGYFPHSFLQVRRLGGWRPQVFMQHGLMVGMWMMLAALVAIWLWQAGVVRKIWGMPIAWLAGALFVTFVLCRSTGAYAYMLYGLIILFTAKWARTSLPLLLLIAGICIYLSLAASGNFDGDGIVSFVADVINPERAQSLQFRWNNEAVLGERARERILFGWGGWGRNEVAAENWAGEFVDSTTTDSLWIIVFGTRGIFGLVNLIAFLLLPPFWFFWFRYPARTWFNPKVAPAAVLAVGLTLFMADGLLNAMFNPIFPLISGGLSALAINKPESLRKIKQIKGDRFLPIPMRQRRKIEVKGG